MSADSVVVFYGAQVPLSEDDITACEERTHPLIRAAREAKLDHYWTDFIPQDDQGPVLLIGRRLGVFGMEGSIEAHTDRGALVSIMDIVDSFLTKTGVKGLGRLIVRYQQDL